MAEPRLILCAHDLSPAPSGDAAERGYWVPFAEFAALAEELAPRAAEKGVALAFTADDGFASDYEHFLPWLVETGRTATFFIPAAFVGRPHRLTAGRLREMHALGMAIGGHGVDHLKWTEADGGQLANEIVAGKARLEDILGARLTAVAPPFGAYDARVVRACLRAGYTEIHTTRGGFSLGPGVLRPRTSVVRGPAVRRALIALLDRRPGFADRLHGLAREVQARVA